MDEQAWLRKGAAILTDIKAWRQAHPTATFVEIEDEIHRRLMELEAHVLQDAAQTSASREWGREPDQPAPICPTCAVPLQARGKHQRTLQGNGGQTVTLSRTYGTCPTCHQSFFPLDRELQLLSGSLAPRQHEHLVHLASCLPFEQAARMLGDLLSVQVSAETARRLTEQMGSWMDVAQIVEQNASPVESTSQPAPDQCVISADGAMISLVHKQWVEVRTAAIGEPVSQAKSGKSDDQEIHVNHLSYFSRLADASTFIELAAGEMQQRKGAQARQVCAVTDGAEWCQVFVDRYRPDAVRILDFPHAAEHLSTLLEACEQAGLRLPAQMLSRCLHVLKHRGPAALLRMANRLSAELVQQKGIEVHVEYLRKREALMQYPQFRAQGWPIGSGMVESANKLVVQARLKGPGMRLRAQERESHASAPARCLQ